MNAATCIVAAILGALLTLPYTFRGQNWSILFSLSNIEFT